MSDKKPRAVSYPGIQSYANVVFAPSGKNHPPPRMGLTNAYAVLKVGELIKVPDGKGGYVMDRAPLEVPITHFNLARHLKYDVAPLNFLMTAASFGVRPDELSQKIFRSGSWNMFNEQVIQPLRTKYGKYGIEEIPMWFFSCPSYDLKPDSNGNVHMILGEESPLILIPKSLEKAGKKWKLSESLLKELAILTYWITIHKLIPHNIVSSLDEAKKVVEGCYDYLPKGLFSDFEDKSKQSLVQSRKKRQQLLLG